MAKVMFVVSYEIVPEDRNRYLILVHKMKELMGEHKVHYSVYEEGAKSGAFREVYLYADEQEYEYSDDLDLPIADQIAEEIYGLAKDGKVSYATLKETV